jgi:type I restriction enzyme S subunit
MEFYRETSFQDIDIGKIPIDWLVKMLGEVVEIKNGQRPIIKDDGDIPIYGANGVMGYTSKSIADDGYTILIGRVGASGEVNNARGKIWVSDNAFYTERFEKREADPEFIFYLLKFKQLSQYARKSTHPIISLSFLRSFSIQLPRIQEQRAIASLFLKLDDLIQQTDSIIRKTQELKKGLMQELLTKGIGHKEFKYSEELGCEIPKEWELKNIEDICDVNKETLANKTDGDYEFYYIDIGGVAYAGAKPVMQQMVFKDAPSRAKRRVKKDDILVSTVRPYLRAFTYIDDDIDNLICSTGYAVLATKQAAYSRFVYQYILSDYFLNQLVPMGSSYPAVTSKQVERVNIPLPKKEEQKQIAAILTNIDVQIENAIKSKEELEKLKKGLMNIFLTGQVRIKVN